jgi:hypothetical protein
LGLETSHLHDERVSDMSLCYNLNEFIGSMDEKIELKKMKDELQEKDACIQELLRKIE